MLGERIGTGVRVGLVLAATTAGVLVGFGLRHGSALTPFLQYGGAILTALTGTLAPQPVAIAVGLIAHTVWMTLWGVCFTVVATPLRSSQALLGAVAFAALLGVAASTFLPGALGAAGIASLSASRFVLLIAVTAVTLLVGTRLARRVR